MSTTVLGDLIQNEQFAIEALRASIRKSVFWESNVIIPDSNLQKMMSSNKGSVFKFNYYNDLADNEGRISDDTNTLAGVDNINTGINQAVGQYRNRSWGAANITSNLSATGDPLPVIAGRVGAYWARQYDLNVLAMVRGVLEANINDDASDMLVNKGTEKITIEMINNTKQTAGDASDMFDVMICHSAIKTSLENSGLTNNIYSDKGEYLYTALSGLRLVVSDQVGSNQTLPGSYYSYIVGKSMFGWGAGTPKKAEEVESIAGAGNGAGSENLWSRRNYSLHPYGFSFTNDSVASTSPTNAEFMSAANWERTIERKKVPFACLLSLA